MPPILFFAQQSILLVNYMSRVSQQPTLMLAMISDKLLDYGTLSLSLLFDSISEYVASAFVIPRVRKHRS